MVDYHALMRVLSVPRPNGSAAERATSQALQQWLAECSIAYRLHTFRLYPYFFESIGVWLIASRTLLAVCIGLRWGWIGLIVALLGTLGGVLDVAARIPTVSWIGARRGENILIGFGPAEPRQELIFSAHYDSKTELLDHAARLFFLRKLRLGIVLTLILGVLCVIDHLLMGLSIPWADAAFWAGLVLCVPMLFLAWGLGLNLSLGRLLKPSQGAVDNGAACAILLGFADRLASGAIPLRSTRVTLALFTGEEANMQGSRAYVRDRDWLLPAAAINLEIMGQNGDYVFWEQDGTAFGLLPTSQRVSEALTAAVRVVTHQAPCPAGPINSDGGSFLAKGVPAGVLGSYDRLLGSGGFHRPTDHIGRVILDRLPEAVDILARLLDDVEQGRAPICEAISSPRQTDTQSSDAISE